MRYPSRPSEHLPEQVPLKPPAWGPGDIPVRVVYLIGASVGTIVAVALIFMLFSGDVPANRQAEQAVSVAPVPPSAIPTSSPTPSATATPIVLPPVPESKAYATLSGTQAAVIGLITDKTNGISYPKLASPWKARSYPPFTIAQRIGEVKMPFTVIGSAMYPGDSPAEKPSSNADYRKIATEGVRWTILTQYPKGATISWTASQKIPVGKGWTLGYKVTYLVDGKKQTAQAMLAVVEVGKTKPAMLLASIPEANKAHWRDLNTLAQQVRPL
ncbi:hypothetical protein ABGB18_20525 [Nonomuraea sp. B12E4]|uniref:hypothetical protein n=1 Tax=Nonomuraea sp. B12E4 TaxID=3153564 RepID=UPI00325E8057